MPKKKTDNTTPLEQARAVMGFTARSVARTLSLDPSGLLRIERGKFTPRQDTARTIEGFYSGIVPLGMVYDTTHPKYEGFITSAVTRKLRKRANQLEALHDTLRRAGKS